MQIIKTFCNLRQLHHDKKISNALFYHLHGKLESLQKALEPDLEDLEKFSLCNHGPIGIFEEGDKDLSSAGLPASFEPIMPEWVGRVKLGGKLYYVLYVLADNDYCIQIYLPNKILDKAIRKWLASQTVEDEGEIKLDNFTYSSKACVFRKYYGSDIHVMVCIELPKGNLQRDKRNKAIRVFKDELYNLLNDPEMEQLLKPY